MTPLSSEKNHLPSWKIETQEKLFWPKVDLKLKISQSWARTLKIEELRRRKKNSWQDFSFWERVNNHQKKCILLITPTHRPDFARLRETSLNKVRNTRTRKKDPKTSTLLSGGAGIVDCPLCHQMCLVDFIVGGTASHRGSVEASQLSVLGSHLATVWHCVTPNLTKAALQLKSK